MQITSRFSRRFLTPRPHYFPSHSRLFIWCYEIFNKRSNLMGFKNGEVRGWEREGETRWNKISHKLSFQTPLYVTLRVEFVEHEIKGKRTRNYYADLADFMIQFGRFFSDVFLYKYFSSDDNSFYVGTWKLFTFPKRAGGRVYKLLERNYSLIKDNFIIVCYLIVASVSSGIYPIA
jgi:hypothetical protein